MALRKCGDLVILFLSARAAVSLSHLPLKFPFSPMRIIARCIKHSLDVATERLHHADVHHHGGSILFGDQDQGFDRRFGVDVTVVRLSSVFCAFWCSTTWNTSSFTDHGRYQCSLLAGGFIITSGTRKGVRGSNTQPGRAISSNRQAN
jgi:hypothetical protein